MNILLIDDHFCAREGVACLLRELFVDVVIHQAERFDDGLAIARSQSLNWVLLDVQLPGKDGLLGLAELKRLFPNLSVVMYSGLDDRERVFEALRLGAMGFITKSLPRHDFISALQDIMAGKVVLPVSVIASQPTAPASRMQRPALDDLALTKREMDVLGWVVQGKCNKEIARKLGIEEQTVKNHLRPIFQKFGVARRAELLIKVFEQGLSFGKPDVCNG